MHFTLFLRKCCSSLQCVIFLPLFSFFSTKAKLHLQSQWYVCFVFLMNFWLTLPQTFISRLRAFENWVVTLLKPEVLFTHLHFRKKCVFSWSTTAEKTTPYWKKIPGNLSTRKSHLIGEGLWNDLERRCHLRKKDVKVNDTWVNMWTENQIYH